MFWKKSPPPENPNNVVHMADWNDGPWGKPPKRGQKPTGSNRPGKTSNAPEGPDFDEIFRKSQEQFGRMFGGGNNNGDSSNPGRGIVIALTVLALFWVGTGVYIVEPGEQGVVTRFGAYHRTTTPGLNLHLPYPVENVYIPKVEEEKEIEIGFRSGINSRFSDSAAGTIPQESLMLTGDENIVKIHFEVQWKIKDAPNFIFNIRNPEETVRDVAESAMREVIGKTKIATVLAQGKAEVEASTKTLIQETLDDYESGILIRQVNLQDVDPPSQVIDAFRDVQSARADAESAINKAEAYKNDILPRARGQAAQITENAEAYKQEVVARADGQASRFLAVYEEYKVAKDVTEKRLYLETLEEMLPGMDKIIIDSNSSQGVLPYLPLPEIKKKQSSGGAQ